VRREARQRCVRRTELSLGRRADAPRRGAARRRACLGLLRSCGTLRAAGLCERRLHGRCKLRGKATPDLARTGPPRRARQRAGLEAERKQAVRMRQRQQPRRRAAAAAAGGLLGRGPSAGIAAARGGRSRHGGRAIDENDGSGAAAGGPGRQALELAGDGGRQLAGEGPDADEDVRAVGLKAQQGLEMAVGGNQGGRCVQ
jgi:hypothetical protein